MNSKLFYLIFVIALAIGGVLLSRSVYRSIRKGGIWLMGRTMHRSADPTVFWSLVFIRTLAAAIFLALGILGFISYLEH